MRLLYAALMLAATPFVGAAMAHAAPSGWVAAALPGTQQFDLQSAHTGQTYRIFVSVPPGEAPEGGYSVLWMLDGNASYPPAIPFLGQSGGSGPRPDRGNGPAAGPGIVVAVGFPGGRPFDVDGRARSYTPEPDAETGDGLSPEHGRAADFLRFLVEELRPAIAVHYPLAPDRHTLFGFSYGGLFTVNTALAAPRHFQRYWAASPSLWFSDNMLMRRLEDGADALAEAPGRIAITVGESEQFPSGPLGRERRAHLDRRAMVDNTKRAADLFSAAGWDVDYVMARERDHFDMLMHGARHVVRFAFTP